MASNATPFEGQSLMERSTVAAEDPDNRLKRNNEEYLGSSRKARTPPLLLSWWLEGLAIVVSLLLLAAIMGVLYRFDGKEQPDWPYWINLNTVVATLSTILRAQLLLVAAEAISQYKWSWFHRPRRLIDIVHFDEASRGLMGSLSLLLRPRKSYMALCSALVFVLSAVIGPFTQQTIRTFGCELPSHNDSASVPLAEYLSYETDIGTYRVGTAGVAAQVSPQMSIAVLEGIVGSLDQANNIQVSCSTGNCDFYGPDESPISYSSLAICSSCEDISDHITESRIDQEEYPAHYWSYNFSNTDPTYLALREGGNPGFLFNDGSYPFLNIQAPKKEGLGSSANYSPSTNITLMSFTWANCSLPATYSDWFNKVDCSSYSRFSGLQNKVGLVAANCSLHVCVRNYASIVRNGQLEEKTVSINKETIAVKESVVVDNVSKVDDVAYRLFKDPCFLDGQRYTTTNLSQAPHSAGRKFTTLLVENEPVQVPLECTFGIDKHFSWGLFQYLHDIFQSSCQFDSWAPEGIWIVCLDGWWYKPLFNQGNASLESVSAAFEKLSLAITARMRTTGRNAYNTEPGRAVGTVTRSAVCIQVYWPWLTLHIFLVVWTGLIFAVVLYDSQRLREVQPVWKHSSLVPFFHTLRYEDQRNRNTTRKPAPVEVGSMDDTASKMVVQLQLIHEGYAFVGEADSRKPMLQSPPLESTSMRQSTDTESQDVLAEPDFGPHFSSSADEAWRRFAEGDSCTYTCI